MTHDPATLDQLRVLVTIADTGSFSAAGRRLHRVQSAVSHAVAAVEEQLGVALFDRSSRTPVLTAAGRSVVAIARDVCARADDLRRLADALGRREEPLLEVAVDVLYPVTALASACRGFSERWPAVQLRLHTDTLGSVSERVRAGTCRFGVVGPAADVRGLVVSHLGRIRMVPVVAPSHALCAEPGPMTSERLAEHVQVVLSERTTDVPTPDQAVLSSRTWRVHDLHTKRALLLEGLGWGNLPTTLVADDLGSGRLVQLRPSAWPPDGISLSLAVVTRPDSSVGPAAQWLVDRLAEGCDDVPVVSPAGAEEPPPG